MPNLPTVSVPRATAPFSAGHVATWSAHAQLAPLRLADGSTLAVQQTIVSLCYDDTALHIHYACDDRDIWGTYTQRDEPIYDQEVVECFIGAGTADPVHYFEFQVSPNGVLFDSTVYNPTSQRADMTWDLAWDCPGIQWSAHRDDAAQIWSAHMSLPWNILTADSSVPAALPREFLSH